MSSQKRKVFGELISEVRMSQNATARFDQAVAEALGVNRTDMRCIDVLDREGPVTAGRLAEATGLTTGAITTVIDRLERAGLARRLLDSRDRRRVLVELVPEAHERADGFYRDHAERAEAVYRRYTQSQLKLLLDFIREGREFNERQAAALEKRNRGAGQAITP